MKPQRLFIPFSLFSSLPFSLPFSLPSSLSFSLFVSSLALLPFSCVEKKKRVHVTGPTMGTTYNIKYVPTQKTPSKKSVASKAITLLDQVNQEFSTYLPESTISRFNRHNKVDEWFPIGPHFYTVTHYALKVARETKGVFDPTLGPLVNLWGFGPKGKKKVPSPKEIKKAQAQVGYAKIEIRKKAIKKRTPEIYLDLSALAKGHGVDRLGHLLESFGISSYMVEIGGEILAKGNWKVGIEMPDSQNIQRKSKKILKLTRHAVATSGSYRNFFENQQKTYSHIIDPIKGHPIEHPSGINASVTVVDSHSCMVADSWATALMAMGPEKGFQFAEKKAIAAYFIYRSRGEGKFRIRGTKQFQRIFEQ